MVSLIVCSDLLRILPAPKTWSCHQKESNCQSSIRPEWSRRIGFSRRQWLQCCLTFELERRGELRRGRHVRVRPVNTQISGNYFELSFRRWITSGRRGCVISGCCWGSVHSCCWSSVHSFCWSSGSVCCCCCWCCWHFHRGWVVIVAVVESQCRFFVDVGVVVVNVVVGWFDGDVLAGVDALLVNVDLFLDFLAVDIGGDFTLQNADQSWTILEF